MLSPKLNDGEYSDCYFRSKSLAKGHWKQKGEVLENPKHVTGLLVEQRIPVHVYLEVYQVNIQTVRSLFLLEEH